MTHFPQPNPANRPTRIKLSGSVLIAIRSQTSGAVRAKLYVLSTTGGLCILAKPLEQGDFVEVTFQTSKGAVRAMAEMLQPMRTSTSSCLQPFRFVALDDEDHTTLRTAIDSLLHEPIIGVRSGKATL